MTLIILGLAWLAGIAMARWLAPPLPVLGLLAVPALAAALLWRPQRGPRLASLCTLALLAGAARLLWATPYFGPDDLAYYNDQGRVRLVGVVADEPDVRDTYQNLRLRAETLTRLASDGEADVEERSVKGMVLGRVPHYPPRAYGERLAVTCELETLPISVSTLTSVPTGILTSIRLSVHRQCISLSKKLQYTRLGCVQIWGHRSILSLSQDAAFVPNLCKCASFDKLRMRASKSAPKSERTP